MAKKSISLFEVSLILKILEQLDDVLPQKWQTRKNKAIILILVLILNFKFSFSSSHFFYIIKLKISRVFMFI